MAGSPPLEAILERLERVTGPDRDGWFTAICVFHKDRAHPNLRIREGFFCLACGAKGGRAVLAAKVGLTSPPPLIEDRIVREYDYHDTEGKRLFQVVRLFPKSFRQRRPDGAGGWIWDMKGVSPVLYRLPDVLCADPDETVFITEGEKDADRLVAEGLIATTAPMGAGKWRSEYNGAFAGRRVVVLRDNDEAGHQHSQAIGRGLLPVAAEVRCLLLPGLAEKGDVSDWLDAGGTVEELKRLANAAPLFVPDGPSPTEPEQSFRQTDAGNGELFARLYGDRVRFDHRRAIWLIWAGHWWRQDADGEVRRLAKEAARHRFQDAVVITDLDLRAKEARFAIGTENRGRLDSMLLQARTELPIADAGDRWDGDAMLLGVTNGVVDLRTGQLRPGRPEDQVTKHTSLVFDPAATCPRWLQFLAEVFGGDRDLADYIWRCVGYSLSGDISEQCVFTCYGGGANGKSVFLTVIHQLAGDYGHIAPFSTFEAQSRPSIPNDLAALAGRRLVTASETNEGVKLNESRLKALTGGEQISARFLNHEWFTFEPVGKFWLAFNHKPQVADDSFGFWRRVRLIPFLQQFTTNADPLLIDKLRAELPGILAWAVRGCLEWQKRGLTPPKSVTLATEAYRQESDPLAAFLDEMCVVRADAVVGATEAYRAYQSWAGRSGFRLTETLTSTLFGRRMSSRFEKQHTKTGNTYRGAGLLSERVEAPELATVKGLVKGFESDERNSTSELEQESLTREDMQKAFTTLHPSLDEETCGLCPEQVWLYDAEGQPRCKQHADLPGGQR